MYVPSYQSPFPHYQIYQYVVQAHMHTTQMHTPTHAQKRACTHTYRDMPMSHIKAILRNQAHACQSNR